MSAAAIAERQLLGKARRIVVKVGSRLLRESSEAHLAALAGEVAALARDRKVETVLVSSGAIALGRGVLGLATRPHELPRLQAVAAVGQGHLMQRWERAFAGSGRPVGQVLLTHADLSDRARFLNARRAVLALIDYGAVPIINENDTVAVEEIKFGDNDQLAGLVCNLVSADALLVLTDVEGLCDAHPDQGGKRIPLVRDIDREAAPVAGGSRSGLGTGGMASKVQAARVAGRSGVPTAVLPGRQAGAITSALDGADIGTLFLPPESRLASRKHWIAFASRAEGAVLVDDGARRALVEQRKSLLPSGIQGVRGTFAIGDAVSVVGPDGQEFARGLIGYASDEVERIRGRRTADIEPILGYKYLDEVIHRDDLVIL